MFLQNLSNETYPLHKHKSSYGNPKTRHLQHSTNTTRKAAEAHADISDHVHAGASASATISAPPHPAPPKQHSRGPPKGRQLPLLAGSRT